MSHAQEVFDKVVAHLLTQNEKSQVGDDCMYYSGTQSKPLKCAVGCLIAEEYYTVKLEGLGASDSDVQQALRLSGIDLTATVANRSLVHLLGRLQQIHDGYDEDQWFSALKEAAQYYGLTFNPPAAIETHNA
jgi:hypothetical protein